MIVNVSRMPNAEEIIRAGIIPIGRRDTAPRLAAFLDQMKRNRAWNPRRRLGTVGSISTVGGQTQGGLVQAWYVTGQPTGLQAPIVSQGIPPTASPAARGNVTYTYGSSGATAINQIMQVVFTVTNGTPNSFAMDTWTGYLSVLNDSAPTCSAVKEWTVELLTVAQGGGATASAVVCGDAASNAWAGILSSTGTYTIASGGLWHHQDQTSAGIAVVASNVLKIANSDSSNIATLRITMFGFK